MAFLPTMAAAFKVGELYGVMRLVDAPFYASLNAVNKSLALTSVAMQQQFRQVGDSAIQAAGKWFTAGATLSLGIGLAGAEFASFEQEMRNVNTLAKLSEGNFKNLSKEVVVLSHALKVVSPTELAKGLYEISSSGFAGSEGMGILQESAYAASAGRSDLKTASRAVVGLINAYKELDNTYRQVSLSAKDAAYVSGVLFQTVNLGIITFEELTQNIGDVAFAAADAQIPITEVGAAIATMTRKGIIPAEATTSLRRLIQGFTQPSEKLNQMLKQVGISGYELLRKEGLLGALELLKQKGLMTGEVLAQLFPEQRELRGVISLMSGGLTEFRELNNEFKNRTALEQMHRKAYEEQSKSIKFAWMEVVNHLKLAGVNIGEQLVPLMKDLAIIAKVIAQIISSIPAGVLAWVAKLFLLIAGFKLIQGVVNNIKGGLLGLANQHIEKRVAEYKYNSAQISNPEPDLRTMGWRQRLNYTLQQAKEGIDEQRVNVGSPQRTVDLTTALDKVAANKKRIEDDIEDRINRGHIRAAEIAVTNIARFDQSQTDFDTKRQELITKINAEQPIVLQAQADRSASIHKELATVETPEQIKEAYRADLQKQISSKAPENFQIDEQKKLNALIADENKLLTKGKLLTADKNNAVLRLAQAYARNKQLIIDSLILEEQELATKQAALQTELKQAVANSAELTTERATLSNQIDNKRQITDILQRDINTLKQEQQAKPVNHEELTAKRQAIIEAKQQAETRIKEIDTRLQTIEPNKNLRQYQLEQKSLSAEREVLTQNIAKHTADYAALPQVSTLEQKQKIDNLIKQRTETQEKLISQRTEQKELQRETRKQLPTSTALADYRQKQVDVANITQAKDLTMQEHSAVGNQIKQLSNEETLRKAIIADYQTKLSNLSRYANAPTEKSDKFYADKHKEYTDAKYAQQEQVKIQADSVKQREQLIAKEAKLNERKAFLDTGVKASKQQLAELEPAAKPYLVQEVKNKRLLEVKEEIKNNQQVVSELNKQIKAEQKVAIQQQKPSERIASITAQRNAVLADTKGLEAQLAKLDSSIQTNAKDIESKKNQGHILTAQRQGKQLEIDQTRATQAEKLPVKDKLVKADIVAAQRELETIKNNAAKVDPALAEVRKQKTKVASDIASGLISDESKQKLERKATYEKQLSSARTKLENLQLSGIVDDETQRKIDKAGKKIDGLNKSLRDISSYEPKKFTNLKEQLVALDKTGPTQPKLLKITDEIKKLQAGATPAQLATLVKLDEQLKGINTSLVEEREQQDRIIKGEDLLKKSKQDLQQLEKLHKQEITTLDKQIAPLERRSALNKEIDKTTYNTLNTQRKAKLEMLAQVKAAQNLKAEMSSVGMSIVGFGKSLLTSIGFMAALMLVFKGVEALSKLGTEESEKLKKRAEDLEKVASEAEKVVSTRKANVDLMKELVAAAEKVQNSTLNQWSKQQEIKRILEAARLLNLDISKILVKQGDQLVINTEEMKKQIKLKEDTTKDERAAEKAKLDAEIAKAESDQYNIREPAPSYIDWAKDIRIGKYNRGEGIRGNDAAAPLKQAVNKEEVQYLEQIRKYYADRTGQKYKPIEKPNSRYTESVPYLESIHGYYQTKMSGGKTNIVKNKDNTVTISYQNRDGEDTSIKVPTALMDDAYKGYALYERYKRGEFLDNSTPEKKAIVTEFALRNAQLDIMYARRAALRDVSPEVLNPNVSFGAQPKLTDEEIQAKFKIANEQLQIGQHENAVKLFTELRTILLKPEYATVDPVTGLMDESNTKSAATLLQVTDALNKLQVSPKVTVDTALNASQLKNLAPLKQYITELRNVLEVMVETNKNKTGVYTQEQIDMQQQAIYEAESRLLNLQKTVGQTTIDKLQQQGIDTFEQQVTLQQKYLEGLKAINAEYDTQYNSEKELQSLRNEYFKSVYDLATVSGQGKDALMQGFDTIKDEQINKRMNQDYRQILTASGFDNATKIPSTEELLKFQQQLLAPLPGADKNYGEKYETFIQASNKYNEISSQPYSTQQQVALQKQAEVLGKIANELSSNKYGQTSTNTQQFIDAQKKRDEMIIELKKMNFGLRPVTDYFSRGGYDTIASNKTFNPNVETQRIQI